MTEPIRLSVSLPDARRRLLRAADSGTGDELDPELDDIRARGMAEIMDARWRSTVTPRFADATWEEIGDPRAAEQLRAWSTAPRQPNLLVLGPVGTGKTSAAAVALRASFDACLEVHFAEVGMMLQSLRPDGGGCLADLLEADRLFIDDVGQETKTAWTREQLGIIITARYNERWPTVVTSNFNAKDLKTHLEPHTASRLMGDGATLVVMRGDDRRKP